MVTLINLYLVYFYVQTQFETKIRIKITFIIISIYVSLAKSLANGAIRKNIVILDPLEAQKIKMMTLLMIFGVRAIVSVVFMKKLIFTIKIHVFINMGVLFHLQCPMMVGLSPCTCLC